MAKTKYNPMTAIKEDPLAGLKEVTAERAPSSLTYGSMENRNSGLPGQTSPRDSFSGQAVPTSYQEPPVSSAPVKLLSASLKPSRNTVYLYPEDLTKLRQLSGYASTEHGVRANDSMIVRAALSLMDTDVRFLHALKEAELSDRRRTVRPS